MVSFDLSTASDIGAPTGWPVARALPGQADREIGCAAGGKRSRAHSADIEPLLDRSERECAPDIFRMSLRKTGVRFSRKCSTTLGRVGRRRDLRSRRALEARMSPAMFIRLVVAWTGALGALLVLALSIRWFA
jgi:hypothetical protein